MIIKHFQNIILFNFIAIDLTEPVRVDTVNKSYGIFMFYLPYMDFYFNLPISQKLSTYTYKKISLLFVYICG